MLLCLSFSLQVFAGNITTFSRKTLTFFKQNPQYHIGLLAETHLSPAMADDEEVRLQKQGMRGIHAHGQPGLASQAALLDPEAPGGIKGGTAVLSKRHLRVGSYPKAARSEMADDIAPCIVHLKGVKVLMVAAYLRPGLGLTGDNLRRLQSLGAMVGATTHPWLIYADWNIVPEELEASHWLDLVHGTILQPRATTGTCLQGQVRMLDYLVVGGGAKRVIGDISLARDTPWKAHRGLTFEVAAPAELLEGWRLHLPAPFPARARPPKAPDPGSKSSRMKAKRGQLPPAPLGSCPPSPAAGGALGSPEPRESLPPRGRETVDPGVGAAAPPGPDFGAAAAGPRAAEGVAAPALPALDRNSHGARLMWRNACSETADGGNDGLRHKLLQKAEGSNYLDKTAAVENGLQYGAFMTSLEHYYTEVCDIAPADMKLYTGRASCVQLEWARASAGKPGTVSWKECNAHWWGQLDACLSELDILITRTVGMHQRQGAHQHIRRLVATCPDPAATFSMPPGDWAACHDIDGEPVVTVGGICRAAAFFQAMQPQARRKVLATVTVLHDRATQAAARQGMAGFNEWVQAMVVKGKGALFK